MQKSPVLLTAGDRAGLEDRAAGKVEGRVEGRVKGRIALEMVLPNGALGTHLLPHAADKAADMAGKEVWEEDSILQLMLPNLSGSRIQAVCRIPTSAYSRALIVCPMRTGIPQHIFFSVNLT